MHAVIETGGKQYRVAVGDTLKVERLVSPEGQKGVEFPVLLIEKDQEVQFGTPHLKGAKVLAEVVEEKKAKKILAYKYKRRKGYDKQFGHRQILTTVKITEIKAGQDHGS